MLLRAAQRSPPSLGDNQRSDEVLTLLWESHTFKNIY